MASPTENANIKRGMSLLLEEAMKAQDREAELVSILQGIADLAQRGLRKVQSRPKNRVEPVATNGETAAAPTPHKVKRRRGPNMRQRTTPVSEAEKDEMMKLYTETSISGTEIAKQFHVSSAYIYMVASKRGLNPRPNPTVPKRMDEEQVKEVLAFIKEKPELSRQDVADHFGLSTSTITKYAVNAGLSRAPGLNNG